jgi:hypothetical protein
VKGKEANDIRQGKVPLAMEERKNVDERKNIMLNGVSYIMFTIFIVERRLFFIGFF